MAGYDIAVQREGLRRAAERYAEVADDHDHFFEEAQVGHAIPHHPGREAPAEVIMDRKDDILASLDELNGLAHKTLARLQSSLDDTHRDYAKVEEVNEELVRRTARYWESDYGHVENVDFPRPGGLPARSDWSTESAAQRGHLGEPLRTDWADLESTVAAMSLDPSYWAPLGGSVAGAVEGFLDWTGFCQTVDKMMVEYLPVFQLGQVLKRTGDGYIAIGEDLDHDRLVLASNWTGAAADSAEDVFVKLREWFHTAGGQVKGLGDALEDRAETSLSMQMAAINVLTDLVGMSTSLLSALQLALDVGSVLQAALQGRPEIALAAAWDTLLTLLGLVKQFLGLFLALWHFAIGVEELIRFTLASSHKGFAPPPPVWEV